ncbi:MAG TPA: glycosyltransferase family 4 protein [Longimicrobium sp.]|nr:glycosyltransferase family 4 protein [Longimicrobium sp.]
MRIAYLSRGQMPAPSASSLQIMKNCEAFVHNGDPVTLVAVRAPGTRVPDADVFAQYGVEPVFELHRIPVYPVRGQHHLHALRGVLIARRFRADVVHGRCVWSCLMAARTGFPVGIEVHTLPNAGERATAALLRLARHPNLRAIVVTSDRLRQDLVAAFPIAAASVVVAHNGAEPRARPDPVALPADLPNVGYVGRLYEGKGADLVVALAARCPWARFHLVGGTREEIERWRPRVAGLANVHFHEFVPHAQGLRYLDACDVMLVPYEESVEVHGGATQSGRWMAPIKLFECMAAGKPVIASDLPVAREVLVEGETGFLCPPGDVDRWEATLGTLARSPELRARVGENARRVLAERFTWSARARLIRRALAGVGG